jgi:hypothetical protein
MNKVQMKVQDFENGARDRLFIDFQRSRGQ